MDVLYKTYSRPFDYLQQLMDIDNLPNGIEYIFSQENERKLWELYLHSFPNESYEDWKKKVCGNAPSHANEMSRSEVINVVKKSQNILNTFSIE